MGVQGLLSFLRSENLCERVKLADIAAEYRKKTGKRPVLVVDSSSCLPLLYSGKSLVLAAELKKFEEKCQEFLNRFNDSDIQLYIIDDGLKSEVKIQSWMKSTDRIIENSNFAYRLHDISRGNDRGGYLYGIARQVFTSSNKCEFHRSIYEASHFIAQYLKENGAFGVISNNTDVILMDGSQYYLSTEDLNLSEMTTFNFNRDKLAEFLKIKAQLLPHWGTLCPNNVLDYFDLKKFSNKRIGKADKTTRFKAVADVVRKCLSDFNPGDYSPKRLQHCRSELCLDEHQLERYMKRLRILNGEPDEEPEGIEDKHWNDILTLAKTLHRTGRTEKFVLEILLEKKFFSGIGLEDVNAPTPGEKLHNVRRKIYGFLFSEYPEEASVTEQIYAFRNGRTAYFSSEVTFERRDHVSLLKLWSADAPEDIQKKKYEYFFDIINEKLNPDILLGKVEEEFIFPLLGAFFLRYELGKFNNPKLMDAFLIHSILANKLSSKEVSELHCKPDFEVLNFCGWYLKVIEHLELVNSVCGHPFDRLKTNIVNYFDGLVLQTVYRDLNAGKGIPEEVIPTFKRLNTVLIEMSKCCGF